MAEEERKNWIELFNAALEAKDANELLNIVKELKKVLKREEQVLRDFWEAKRANHPLTSIGRTKLADTSNVKNRIALVPSVDTTRTGTE